MAHLTHENHDFFRQQRAPYIFQELNASHNVYTKCHNTTLLSEPVW